MGFPDDRDRNIIRLAEVTEDLATDLAHWVAEYNPERVERDLAPIASSDEFELTRLRRMANNLFSSAKVPVAAAVYGPSQVGKSLFVGRLLLPSSGDYSPLGRDEQSGMPAYYQHLSFDTDLNPQSGSNEATALVTRFTTKDRIAQSPAPEYPVMVRALTRAQWLRVLARGFLVECGKTQTPDIWSAAELEQMFEENGRRYAGTTVDRGWRMDLLDAYSYMKDCDRRGFPTEESILNGLLTRYPMSEEGYIAVAAALFWDNWASLTGMFMRVNAFLQKIESPEHDPAILTHWAGVRYLLDSQRAKVHERRNSRCFPRVDWADLKLKQEMSWYVLDYTEGRGGGREDLETIQAAMLELVIPILPHRLSEDWRKVIEQIDILDIPGMRAGRQGAEQGKRNAAETTEEQMEIVKRGKVAYLFERYVDELLIQTLLLLARGGNLEVTAQMKFHIDKWGKARYGNDVWPRKVRDEFPALFLGLTGIDEEFRNRDEYADSMLYEARLSQLADALGDVMQEFGGKSKSFSNVYPLRYPGTWDTDEKQREKAGKDKWEKAGNAFIASKSVQEYCANASEKWAAAMRDDDGGMSLIAEGWRQTTTAERKQSMLEAQVTEIQRRLLQLSRGWVVSGDSNIDRRQRVQCAKRVLDWLNANPQAIYVRVRALEKSLGFDEGDQWRLSDFADIPARTSVGRPDSLENRFNGQLEEFFHEWATQSSPKKWDEFTSKHPEGGPWLGDEDFAQFTRYMRDYFCHEKHFPQVKERLLKVVNLKLRDEAAKRRARRQYVRIMLNDFVMNPGVSDEPLDEVEGDSDQFGLMAPFVSRWMSRLPEVLAAGAGAEIHIPPGNDELTELLEQYGELK
ncbi:virulence factor SrfC family protein [Lignipirellula cremea]|uniref:Bacterial virulence factor n=1 Tax=Lignipirellula cremea TaxID=2528010 RepID=A0A518DTG8_9BACT|nr:virulence factor SrfC family protein [Lignipirellula cremea]QDU95124.1 Putative bacterial virulence factor [Lignipirellula cremea]